MWFGWTWFGLGLAHGGGFIVFVLLVGYVWGKVLGKVRFGLLSLGFLVWSLGLFWCYMFSALQCVFVLVSEVYLQDGTRQDKTTRPGMNGGW